MNVAVKKLPLLLLAAGALSVCAACSDDESAESTWEKISNEKGSLKFAVISDIHLHDISVLGMGGEAWEQSILNGNIGSYALSKPLMEQLLAELKKQDVHCLIVSGDITKEGEKANHAFAADMFRQFEEAGIEVLVINGNHDITYKDAKDYTQDPAVQAEVITSSDFLSIYADYGYDHAVAKDPNGLSYAVNMGEKVQLIFMDSNIYTDDVNNLDNVVGGQLTGSRLEWVLSQVAAAKSSGRTPIGIIHHALVEHLPMQAQLLPDYILKDYADVREKLSAAGMNVVFSGHFHTTDMASATVDGRNFYDIETNSYVLIPGYRLVTLNQAEGTMDVSTVFMDIPSDLVPEEYAGMTFNEYLVAYNDEWFTKNADIMLDQQIAQQLGYELPDATAAQLFTLDLGGTPLDAALGHAYWYQAYGDESSDQYAVQIAALEAYKTQMAAAGQQTYAYLFGLLEQYLVCLTTDSEGKDLNFTISY